MNVLQKAKNVLTQKGWTKNHFEYAGRVCSLGAIYTVTYGNPQGVLQGENAREPENYVRIRNQASDASILLLKIANELYPADKSVYMWGWESIPQFNDAETTTKEMIMHVFSHAASEMELTDEHLPES